MRKVLVEIIILGIALGLTVEVIKSAVPYLPLIWLIVAAHYTWEAATSEKVLLCACRVKAGLSERQIVYSYIVVGLGGAALLCLYWWGLNSFFASKIARYEAEQKQLRPETPQVISKLPGENEKPPAPIPNPNPEPEKKSDEMARSGASSEIAKAEKPIPKLSPHPPTKKPIETPQHTIPPPQSQTFIEVGPSFGNLKERALQLANEIMQDMYRHGWPTPAGYPQQIVMERMPIDDSKKLTEWTKMRSGYFKFRFFRRVIDMRDEFAQLHLRDQQLDDFIKFEEMNEDTQKQLMAIPQAAANAENMGLVLPQQIQEVAERLSVLAMKIN